MIGDTGADPLVTRRTGASTQGERTNRAIVPNSAASART